MARRSPSKPPSDAASDDDAAALVPRLRFPEFCSEAAWVMTTVGSISPHVVAGGTPSTSERSYWGGEIRWMNSGELNLKKVYEVEGRISEDGLRSSSAQLIPPRCTLIGLAGQGRTRGTVAMNFVELCTNQSIAAVYPDETTFVAEFLYHNLDSRYDELRRLSANGEGRGGLNLQIIRSLDVSLPSLREQQRIADCLTSLDDLIAAEVRMVEALKAHKKGLMQNIFPREGEALPRLRFPEFRDGPLWEARPLGELFDTATGGTPERTVKEYWGGVIPWITTSLVDFNVITEAEEFITEAGLENSSAKLFPKNTVLVALYGQGKTRGKVALLGIEATTNQACGAIFPANEIDPVFAFLSLCGRYDEMRGLSNSGGQENLSQGLIRDLPFRYPKDTAEQQRIADCLSSLDAALTAAGDAVAALNAHKMGLMQQLFPSPENRA